MATDAWKQTAGLVGIGAAACAACCEAPIIGVLAAVGFVTTMAYLTVGVIGLAVALPLGVWVHRRRRRPMTCVGGTGPTPVAIGSGPPPPSD